MTTLSLGRQLELLHIEYEYEKQCYEQATQLIGIDRKVKRGDCWFPITIGRHYYNPLDKFVVEIFRTQDTDIEHNFEYGKAVCFFREDASGQISYFPFRAIVSYSEGNKMVVVLPNEAAINPLAARERIGILVSFDETTYQLMFEALKRVIGAHSGRLATLRDIFHSSQAMHEPLKLPAVKMPWLNASQEKAVNQVLCCKDCSIVHGPPGTGKTTTLTEAIGEVLRREPQVLVCAQSNMAVDWISEQLVDRGYNVLRIGNPSRVTDKMLNSTYEQRFANHPDYPTLWAIRRSIRQIYQARQHRSETAHQKLDRLKDKAQELELSIRSDILAQCRIISSTLAGSANAILSGMHFHSLFIDEASQALEAACWIAICKADRVIFAGDYQQLPPTIKNPTALSAGLGRTLMEQIAHNKPNCVTLLTTQYRMNEDLMRFSSEWFYHGQLEAAPQVKHRSLMDELDWPLVWIDSDKNILAGDSGQTEALPIREKFYADSYGRINKAEASLTLNVLTKYLDKIGLRRAIEENIDFGIISPYRAQVQYLRRLIHQQKQLKPLRKAISVNTVDSFQGQERDVIIISMVRANEDKQIGFLNDLRRMNVAMTRARAKLVIIGSVSTLCHHRFYRELYARCNKEDV